MSVVSFILDQLLAVFMWFLLDPAGRQAFWVVESLIVMVGIWGIYFTFREEK